MSEIIIAGRYSLQEELGAGGMGVVFRALDTQTGDIVAIKQIRQDMASDNLLARFQREGDVLRELDHPNIIRLLDTFEEKGQHHLVMRYIAGGNLSQRIAQQPLTLEQIIRIGMDLSDALTQAHKLNIIHRDLKPANILIDTEDNVYLTDFGLAQVVGNKGITSTGAIVGTINYLPPEAFSENPRDARGDIWSFGVILAEMLTGINPFGRSTVLETMWAITSEPPPDLEVGTEAEAIALIDLIYRMLERDPAARIASVRHVGAALEDISQGNKRVTSVTQRFNTPTSQSLRQVRNNLPLQTTPFIGRDRELSELQALLIDPQRRLVSVIAPGGMGKTRLALEIGDQMLEDFSDGVYFVDLAPLPDTDAIAPAVAEAVSYHFQQDGRQQTQQLLDFLHNKALLLILDNFEHLTDGASWVNDLLRAAPHVKVMVTSRQRLNLSSETPFLLDQLDVPDEQTLDSISEYPAVRLFNQSARRARPDFEITPENTGAIVRICRMVEGLPLGIVLAASWLTMLTPDEIAAELEENIEILDSALVDLPERQRGMRAVFDYSWKLLSAEEQDVFIRLSVFRGGFTREAAQAITGARLQMLMALLNKSLLRRDIASGRFSIHELIRQFGEEKLAASANADSTRDTHRDYYLRLLAELVEPLRTSGQIKALAQIETDFENLRLAWRRGGDTGAYPLLGMAAESLFHFARMRNRYPDVMPLFEQLLSGQQKVSTAEERLGYARLLLWSAMIDTGTIATPDLNRTARQLDEAGSLLSAPDLAGQTDYEQWFVQYQQMRSELVRNIDATIDSAVDRLTKRAEQQRDPWRLALAHHLRGYVDMLLKRPEQALQKTEAAYDLFSELGNPAWIAVLANNLAVLMMSVHAYDRAEQYLNECIAIYRAMGDWARAAHSLCVRGNMNFSQGTFDHAKRDFQEAIPLTRELNYPLGMCLAYCGLGLLALVNKDTDEARRHISEAWAATHAIATAADRMMNTVVVKTTHILMNDPADLTDALKEIAPLVRRLPSTPYGWFFIVAVIHTLASREEYWRATEISGAVHTQGDLSRGFQRLIAPTLAEIRTVLGDENYEAAWQQGASGPDFPSLVQSLLSEFDPA